MIPHDQLIGLPWGSQIRSHQGSPFVLIQPALPDLLRDLPRRTQILYPKDIGYILMMLGIGPGVKVIEAGTGSGGLTSALAFSVGREGHVFTYEAKEEVSQHAEKNLKRFGLDPQVTFHVKDIHDGFEQSGVDALFLDLPNPYDYMQQVRAALKPGGAFGCILPTSNQVILLLGALRQARFAFVDVCEIHDALLPGRVIQISPDRPHGSPYRFPDLCPPGQPGGKSRQPGPAGRKSIIGLIGYSCFAEDAFFAPLCHCRRLFLPAGANKSIPS